MVKGLDVVCETDPEESDTSRLGSTSTRWTRKSPGEAEARLWQHFHGAFCLWCVEMDPGSAQEMGLSAAYLSQVSIREAVQVLLETTDVNGVLVPVGIEGRLVRPAQNTAA